MSYRLGLDIGANSIGWCCLDLDGDGKPSSVRDTGVRIFSDGRNPKDKTSLAVARRTARGMRRRRDRYLKRRRKLMAALVRHGLMPNDEIQRKALEGLDPFELRARGLDEALTPHELGRAIFHLNQRRGFQSNRKTDPGDGDEAGKIRAAANKLTSAMEKAGARTLGEYLHGLHADGKPVRARLHGEGAKAEYDLYPQRDMIAAEFDALWQAQTTYHAALLTDQAQQDIADILLFQRALRPVRPGRCTFEPADERAPKALPAWQELRILQDLNHLTVSEAGQAARPLTLDERNTLAGALLQPPQNGKITFDRLRRLLKVPATVMFNLESEKRKHLDGDKTAAILSTKSRFTKAWHDIDRANQNAIVERLLIDQDEAAVVAWLTAEWGLDTEQATAVSRAALPDGHGMLGRTAIHKILPHLLTTVMSYDKAVAAEYPSHSDFRDGEIFDRLPYYAKVLDRHVAFGTGEPDDPEEKRLGRLANPTVHIGLNQLRRVVNAIIRKHGAPDQIVIELARELKQGLEERRRVEREQAENQQKNDRRREQLHELGQADTGENRLRLRLWEELNPDEPHNRRCVYTGEQISIERLFSPEVEIEHLLPFSRSLDNSFTNKTVSLRRANRDKGQRAPYEAFGHNPTGYDWQAISERAANLTKGKRWRFAPDAMDRYENNERDFLDRHLTDTQYLSRLSREYLSKVCDPNKVWVTPGRLTALLRGKWGLNSLLSDHNLKTRTDHRHHAIDAAVVGVTDRALLQRISTAAARAEAHDLDKLVDGMPEPWDGFRENLKTALDTVVVSHRAEHGRGGALHEDTAYGAVADPDAENGYNLVFRKALTDLTPGEIDRIRDCDLRFRVQEYVDGAKGTALRHALAAFSDRTGVRRVRLLKREAGTIAVADSRGRPYKHLVPGENLYLDIYQLPSGEWAGVPMTVFDANAPGSSTQLADPRPHPAARRIMRLYKGDILRFEHDGIERIMKVIKLNPASNRVILAAHNESGNFQVRHDDPEDPFRWVFASYDRLKEGHAQKVAVDPAGQLRNVGRGA